MPRPTVSDRLRVKIRELLRKRGEAAKLARVSGIEPAIISMFRTGYRKTALGLDDLDELSSYFRLSIGELLGAAKPGELSGDEQRMVHAFRVLPPAVQDHFLAILEQASVTPLRAGKPSTRREATHLRPLELLVIERLRLRPDVFRPVAELLKITPEEIAKSRAQS